ncbi:TauD/TfdA family dioxygenase [Enterobacter hormaechei]|uniref:TauD/TfdA family dioxygenase n=1 Tax=Enterobacter hormaechei TaxID=158836 RepID=UPI002A75BD80|nr:TauD/TfdA family dioxygenase [Enterobacter hormaechei]MDY3572436.1 TauD/TfdA family dioxygenase [Enterobacter hormaechei]
MHLFISTQDMIEWKNRLIDTTPHSLNTREHISWAMNIAKDYLGDVNALKKHLILKEGYIILKGLPQDLPSPSLISDSFTIKNQISESVLLGVTEALGFHPFAYKEEKEGNLIHDITPEKGKENSISSNGVKAFPWHTDAAFLSRNIRPWTLSLYCLINQAKTATHIASVEKIIHQLTHDEIDVLMNRQFLHYPPETFTLLNEGTIASVLDRVDGIYEMKFSSHNIKPLTPEATLAFNHLVDVIDRVSIKHQWKPGDMMIFNNLRCVHAREHIHGERWLQRCYGSLTIKTGDILQIKDNNAS